MEKYLQDRAWSMLPCKYREEVKRLYEEFKDVSGGHFDYQQWRISEIADCPCREKGGEE